MKLHSGRSKMRVVALDRYFIFLDVWRSERDGAVDNDKPYGGHTLRIAFVPTDVANEVVFSFYDTEHEYDSEAMQWKDNGHLPYGYYNLPMSRRR
ncbi:MAG: hypothetical protein OXQ31_03585 [Spirochaetaceae bacterium]|nr:hypothetical protein [Spirochaetaceae bacterium]